MIYCNISDNGIEVIQTSNTIFGKEKIIGCITKEIPRGVVVNGLIVEQDQFGSLLSQILRLLATGRKIDKKIAITISDKHVFTHRFNMPRPQKGEDLSLSIINQVGSLLSQDISGFESFYKIINPLNQPMFEVLYTAMPIDVIKHFVHLISGFGLRLTFLTSRSFSLFTLLKPIFVNENVLLYVHREKNLEEYFVFDQKGLNASVQKHSITKTFATEAKSLIKKYATEKNIHINKVIIGGQASLEVHAQESSETLHIPVIKLNEVIDSILSKHRVEFDTNGESKMVYAIPLGMYLLSQSKTSANFVKDVKVDRKETSEVNKIEEKPVFVQSVASEVYNEEKNLVKQIAKEEKEIEHTIEKVEKEEKPQPPDSFQVKEENTGTTLPLISEPLVEYKRSFLSSIFSNPIIVALIFAVFGALVAFGLFIFIAKPAHMTLPFVATPTLTPTPTSVPTATPTPTIDPTLKRTDVKISVQNGTDTTGYAKEIGDFLEEKGYKNVNKTNADKDDYISTLLKVKEGKKIFISLLISDIKDKFILSDSDTLEATSSYDIVLILGKK